MDLKFKCIILINLFSEMKLRRKAAKKVKQAERDLILAKKELERQQDRVDRLIDELKTFKKINSKKKKVS